MRFSHYFKKAFSMPPHMALIKAVRKVKHEWGDKRRRQRDETRPTTTDLSLTSRWRLFPRLSGLSLSDLPVEALQEQGRRQLAHEFDLLGSGFTQVAHGLVCPGLENFRYKMGSPVTGDSEGRWLKDRINQANESESRRIWGLIEQNYTPIDWQLDFKSGYRWSEAIWSPDIVYGDQPGADVKVPWELARMQHLPALAWAYHSASLGVTPDSLKPGTSRASVSAGGLGAGAGFESPQTYLREFKNQILDFIATNPPRYGVNWVCTMDVAIRAANWLVACDLFKAFGATFDGEFEAIFTRSVYEHGLHIRNHLEWDPVLRSNHYLADIAGLLFVAAYLPSNRETNRWLSFGITEFQREVESQFQEDGSNFEASTSYHRLSTEMALYATALVLGLPPERKPTAFSDSHFEKLRRAGEFLMDIAHPKGQAVQMGDNDSGRFLKLQPDDPGGLDHRPLVSALNGLFHREDFAGFAGPELVEEKLVEKLTGGFRVLESVSRPIGADKAYSDFGLYFHRTKNFFLAVRCGSVGQKGNGGHAHNDQLSFELSLGGVPLMVDPGTYVYTPLPEQRNLFRSTAMHNTLAVEGLEQNPWKEGREGLFSLKDRSKARMVQFKEGLFVGEHFGFGTVCRRTLQVKEKVLEGLDECARPETKNLYFHLAPGWETRMNGKEEVLLSLGSLKAKIYSEEGEWLLVQGLYSKAYGQKEPAPVLRLKISGNRCGWKIEKLT